MALYFSDCADSTRMEINQSNFAEKIIEKFGMKGCTPSSLPYTKDVKLSKDDCLPTDGARTPSEIAKSREYASGVASVLWLTRGTRPDLAYPVSRLGRYSSNPGPKMHG